MKVLWVVNKYCGAMHEQVFGGKSTGGLWLDAMLAQAKRSDDEIVVVNIWAAPKVKYLKDGKISYYTVAGTRNEKYQYYGTSELKAWSEIIEREKPDIIELWGTEFPYGLSTLKIASNIPHIVYIQGILESIGRYYQAGLSESELEKAVTLKDLLTHKTIPAVGEAFRKRAQYEEKIISAAGNAIVTNHWMEAYCAKKCPNINFYSLPFSIVDTFFNYAWSEDTMQKHTIMCPAADYPIKGLHMLLKALNIVKRSYPDVRLSIPGTKLRKADSLMNCLKQDGYSKLIAAMLKEYGLEEIVRYTGRLTAEEMAERMSKVNCFVMCSAVESVSSTLIEAMAVGVPCVASFVGGVCEYAVNEKNALVYRFEDYEMLAYNIMRIFEDRDLRKRLSENAKTAEIVQTSGKSDYCEHRKIYEEVLKNR